MSFSAALPNAAVCYRTAYRYDGATYTVVGREQIYTPTGEAKPLEVPVQILAGSSAARHSGKVYGGFPDRYTLNKYAGRMVTIIVRPQRGTLGRVTIFAGSAGRIEIRNPLSWRGMVPSSGEFAIVIDGSGDAPSSYTVTIAAE